MSHRYYCLAERQLDPDGCWDLPPGTLGAVDLAPIGGPSYVFATAAIPFSGENVAAAIGNGERLQTYVPNSSERIAWTALLGVSWTPGWTLLDALWAVLTVDSDPDGELLCKPIMPTHDGRLDLHLGGHSLIRTNRMARKATDTPHWPAIQRVLQRDFARVKDGVERGYRGKGQPDLHQKWLGAMQRKLGLTAEAARDLIGDRKTLPKRPTTTLSDDFNRANDSDVGPDWDASIPQVGDWTLTNAAAQVEATTTGGFYERRVQHSTDLSSDDHYNQGTVSLALNTYASCGPAVRMDAANYQFYGGGPYDGSWRFVRRDAGGGGANLGGITGDPTTDGSTVKVQADGSTITMYENGVQIASATDTVITGNLNVGMWGRRQARFDDFLAEDLVAVGGSSIIPPMLLNRRMVGG